MGKLLKELISRFSKPHKQCTNPVGWAEIKRAMSYPKKYPLHTNTLLICNLLARIQQADNIKIMVAHALQKKRTRKKSA